MDTWSRDRVSTLNDRSRLCYVVLCITIFGFCFLIALLVTGFLSAPVVPSPPPHFDPLFFSLSPKFIKQVFLYLLTKGSSDHYLENPLGGPCPHLMLLQGREAGIAVTSVICLSLYSVMLEHLVIVISARQTNSGI